MTVDIADIQKGTEMIRVAASCLKRSTDSAIIFRRRITATRIIATPLGNPALTPSLVAASCKLRVSLQLNGTFPVVLGFEALRG